MHPPLGVGELDPVAGPERAAVHGWQCSGGGVGADGRRRVAVTMSSSGWVRGAAPDPPMRRTPTTSSPDVTTYCAPGWACTASHHAARRASPAGRVGQRGQRPGDRVDRHPGAPVGRDGRGGGRVDQRRPGRPAGVGDRRAPAAGLPALGAAALRLGQRCAGRHRPAPAGPAARRSMQREPAADPGGPDRLAGAPPQGDARPAASAAADQRRQVVGQGEQARPAASGADGDHPARPAGDLGAAVPVAGSAPDARRAAPGRRPAAGRAGR